MRTIYMAEDGVQFDDEFECEFYEWQLNHPFLKYIHMYDKDGNELDDMFSEDTYGSVMKIVVPYDQSANDIRELADYTGYSYYGHISESGTWVFNEGGNRFVRVLGGV